MLYATRFYGQGMSVETLCAGLESPALRNVWCILRSIRYQTKSIIHSAQNGSSDIPIQNVIIWIPETLFSPQPCKWVTRSLQNQIITCFAKTHIWFGCKMRIKMASEMYIMIQQGNYFRTINNQNKCRKLANSKYCKLLWGMRTLPPSFSLINVFIDILCGDETFGYIGHNINKNLT